MNEGKRVGEIELMDNVGDGKWFLSRGYISSGVVASKSRGKLPVLQNKCGL